MNVLEYFLYIFTVPVAIIGYRIAWWLFPKQLSRRDKYHLSEVDFLKGRAIKAIAGAIVAGGIYIYFIHYCFHKV